MQNIASAVLLSAFLSFSVSGCKVDTKAPAAPAANDKLCNAFKNYGPTSGIELPINSTAIGTMSIGQSFTLPAKQELSGFELSLMAHTATTQTELQRPLTLLLVPALKDPTTPGPDADPTHQLGQSQQFLEVAVGTPTSYKFTLTNPVTLDAGVYWILLESTYTPNDTELVYWTANSSNVITNGEARYLSGANWVNTNVSAWDLVFTLDCL